MAPTTSTHVEERPGRWAAARHRARTIRSAASHPLVLIAVGAVVSGILVPSFTRGAQDHRQALEIKSGLVSSMSEAASPFLAATLANVLAHNGNVPRSYDAAYQQWITKSNDVWTTLRTYVPDDEATTEWSSFMLRMRDVYYFFRLSPAEGGATRAEYTLRLQKYLSRDCAGPAAVCPIVSFKEIDKWLANPRRRFEGSINLYMEEMFFGLRAAMVKIQRLTLDATPRL
jgi:hypothetical protein